MGIGRWDSGIEYMLVDGVPELNFVPELIDYKLRIKGMDKGRVDLAIVSLTSPNVYFGTSDVSAEVARLINDDMAAAQRAYPDRIRFFCSLPWQYPDLALAELDRAVKLGAVGVMVLAHIRERQLIDPHFAPIWAEIDRRTLPVLVHPTTPYGATESGIQNVRYLLASLGFTYDTTLAICQLVMTGFLEKYPNLKIIASHGGGYIPYVASRIDMFYRLSLSKPTWKMPALPSDEAIRDKLLAELGRQPWAPLAMIDVTVRNGIVELWGTITDERERPALVVAAENIPGVKEVRDHMAWVDATSGMVVYQPEETAAHKAS